VVGFSVALFAFTAVAAEPPPEIRREPYPAQAPDEVRNLRSIPEACVWIGGAYTGDSLETYRISARRTRPDCQPRARFVDFSAAQPSLESGWVLNDLIRFPATLCLSQQVVMHVWRKPVAAQVPDADGQGRVRIYLDDARQQTLAGQLASMPLYAAELQITGSPCAPGGR
jgi:hypothetical protein